VSRTIEAGFVLDAQALHARQPMRGAGLVHLSRHTDRLAEAGIVPSVGSVGDSYDTAVAETVIGLFKSEVIHRLGPWRSRDAVEIATLGWVDWFNTLRMPRVDRPHPTRRGRRPLLRSAATRHTAA
jgi:transposase InsO family protein